MVSWWRFEHFPTGLLYLQKNYGKNCVAVCGTLMTCSVTSLSLNFATLASLKVPSAWQHFTKVAVGKYCYNWGGEGRWNKCALPRWLWERGVWPWCPRLCRLVPPWGSRMSWLWPRRTSGACRGDDTQSHLSSVGQGLSYVQRVLQHHIPSRYTRPDSHIWYESVVSL